jgi:hypothetical protein
MKFHAGQKVRIIGDTFEADPHMLPIGEVFTVESISPATKFEDFPPMIQFIIAIEGLPETDLPERVHIRFGDGFEDFGNVVFEDLEPVEARVKMLEDDFFDGYSEGDEFEVQYDDEGDGFFTDKDGDTRFLVDHEHEIIE